MSPAVRPAEGLPVWLIPAALLALGAAAAAVLAWRRRQAVAAEEVRAVAPDLAPAPPVPDLPPPLAVDLPPPPSLAPDRPPSPPAPAFLDPAPRPLAQVELDEPVVARAGLNLVTATADVALTVRNVSDQTARDIAIEVRLTSAQPGQDAAIAGLFAAPVARPATPRFDLAPGDERRIRTLATLPRDAITVLEAGGRPMFVPVVAIRAAHADGQTIAAHALGIERPGQAKLGPFWLDQPSRMYDAIGVRPHTSA